MSLESARLALPFLAAGQAQKELTHNEALALIDMGIGAAAKSAGIETPPSIPVIGECWIVGDTPTDAWSGHAGALACWTESGWRFLAGGEGMMVWVQDQRLWAVREADGWTIGAARAARVVIDDLQVLGAREAAVTAPIGGSVVDVEARSAIAAILDRLIAHGLIDA